MRFTIPEILQAVSDAPTHEKKVSILYNCQSEVLEQILQYNYHPDIKFTLPEGEVPYKKEDDVPVGKSASNLYREGRRLYLFLEGEAQNLKPYRREMLFIELLEGIHWTEAEVLIAVKDKRLEDLYPGLTYESARDAYDRLLPQEKPKTVKAAKVDPRPVKLGVPDFDAAMARHVEKEKVQEETRPLEQPQPTKEKKPMSEYMILRKKNSEEYKRLKAEGANVKWDVKKNTYYYVE